MGECWHGKKNGTCKICREEERDALSGMIPTCVRVAWRAPLPCSVRVRALRDRATKVGF